MTKKLSKITKLKPKSVNQKNSNPAQNGFPKPLKVNCFQCQQSFEVKYIVPRFTYSKKNDWYHWTDKPENQGKYICDACLWKFYHHRKVYWETIADLKKRMKLTTYINKGVIVAK